MLYTVLWLFGVLLASGSALLLARGASLVRPETIAELASTNVGYNRTALRALAQQSADAAVGSFALVVAVVLQLVSVLLVGAPIRLSWIGAFLAVVFFAGAAFVGMRAADRLAANAARRAEARLREPGVIQ